MKKVTIISGNQGTGKTMLAHEMSKGKRVFETSEPLREALKRMPLDTEVIIIEMRFESDILNAIRADVGNVRRPYAKNPTNVFIPDLIITTCLSVEFMEKIKATQILKLSQTI